MRHHLSKRKLNRTSAHRTALLRNMATSLFRYEKIRTTDPKAKELRSYAEKLITISKRGDIHSRRMVARDIHDKEVVVKLFEEIAPRYESRHGGYTRIYKLGTRLGDNAEMSLIELVDAMPETAEETDEEKSEEKSKE